MAQIWQHFYSNLIVKSTCSRGLYLWAKKP